MRRPAGDWERHREFEGLREGAVMLEDPTLRLLLGVVAWSAGALLVGWLTGLVIGRIARRTNNRLLGLLHRRCHRPLVLVLLVSAVHTAIPDTGPVSAALRHAVLLALIAAAAWLVVRLVYVLEDVAFQWLGGHVAAGPRRRRARTQIDMLRRLTAVTVTILAMGTALMTVPSLRALGTSVLASAGVAGAIAGLASQTTLRNVAAGIELAMSNRLRVDDAVVVEGEWGWVEELTLTHVVIRLWDERRLMLPTTYFITTPFQNWTRTESRILGSVVLHLDPRAPVPELRAEARRIIEQSPLWDGRDWVLQVIDSTPWSMVVRTLASAADAPSSWDLRCEIRERLITFLRDEHPDAFPGAPAARPWSARAGAADNERAGAFVIRPAERGG
jgi:small-conductance mechanosensitive channel